MIFSRVLYDAQFFFVTIYKVGKCMMPSVLKICSDFKSCSVFQPLAANEPRVIALYHKFDLTSTKVPFKETVHSAAIYATPPGSSNKTKS